MPGCGMHSGAKLAFSSQKSRQAHSKQIENKQTNKQTKDIRKVIKMNAPFGPFTPWDGPVPPDGVFPFLLLQSKMSSLACFHLHKPAPKAHVSTAVDGIAFISIKSKNYNQNYKLRLHYTR